MTRGKTMMHSKSRQFMTMSGTWMIAGGLLLSTAGLSAVHADDEMFSLRQPLNHATVREAVSIRIPRNLLNQSGYAAVSIDNHFVSAPMVPDSGDLLWKWNTKDPLQTADDPDSTASVPDGMHTISVILYDKASNEIAKASSDIRVANHITSLPDGVRLTYKWHQDEVLGYHVHSELRNMSDAGNDPNQSGQGRLVQVVDAHLNRDVESADSASVLLRDLVDSGDVSDGQSVPNDVNVAYSIKGKYYTVDRSGRLIADNKPLDTGSHFSFPLPAFPPRRVNVGDSWETSIRVSLPWSADKLSTLHGTARLDSFEWEHGYPTAKIVESYDGPAQFYLPGGASTSEVGVVQAPDVHLVRTVWFAYEAGVLVRIDSSLSSDTRMSSDQYAEISGGGSSSPQFASSGPTNRGGPPGGMSAQQAAMMAAAMANSGQNGAPSGFPGGNGFNNGQPSLVNPAASQQSNQIKLSTDESMVLGGLGG